MLIIIIIIIIIIFVMASLPLLLLLSPPIPPPPPLRLPPRTRPKTLPPRVSFCAALRSPRGFGPPPAHKPNKSKKRPGSGEDDDDEEEKEEEYDEEEEEEDDDGRGTIPEAVTNRMMQRVGASVGIPLSAGLSLFPLFYYLKAVAKVEVPTWVPLIASFLFFGTALLGVSYGIVSASWDPLREGSLLGWNEARRNWPVFWESLWGRRASSSSTATYRRTRGK